ncbi:MAG: DUF2589 domain-containing protein [Spirochaetia bacterium]|jgi:hypothetical protein|nr:DUF2589 domain-containing protein [Spirochaetia bacterium]
MDNQKGIRNAIADVPIEQLIAAPFKAAIEAQRQLAQSTVDFISSVGMEKGKTKTISFGLTSPENGESMEIKAPVLALVPLPELAIEEMNIDFQMEVTATDKVEQEDREEQVAVSGKVTSSATGTRETNQSAKYQIHVKAKKQEPPEGLSRILDLLATSVGAAKEEKT